MKKICLFFVMLLAIIISPVLVKAEGNICYNLKASVGEVQTAVGINYHSDYSGTKLHYGTDSTLTTFTECTPEEHTYSKGMTNDEAQTVFAARYVCSVNLTGLAENTRYYYQVVYEDQKSTIQTFKTGVTTKTTFGVLCDTQSWGSNFAISDELVEKLYSINPDINFFMIAGDITDKGGYEYQWNDFDRYMTTLNQQFLQATIPGNHELYHSALASYIDASIYNEYYNNPKNGIPQRLNSSYYFTYNGVLFVMLDTMSRSSGKNYYEEQVAWFKDIAENVQHNFLIVVSHPGCYSAGAYDGDAQIMRGHWRSVFEEYGVDLAISGHEHVYLRTKPLYNDKVDSGKGVTYVIGGCAGGKKYDGKDNPQLFEKLLFANDENGGQYCGSIVEIEGDTLTFKYYSRKGELRDSFTIKSKNQVDPNFDIDEFLDNITVTYNDKTRYNSVVWPSNAYGHLKTVSITIEHLGKTVTKFIGPSANETTVGNGAPTRDYTYTCVFTDYEGNTYTKVVEVKNETDKLRPNTMKLVITDAEEEGKYVAKATYNDNGHEQVFMYLYVNDKKYEFEDDNTVVFDEEPTMDNISIQLLYEFYGNMGESNFDQDSMEIQLNITEPKPEEKDPGQEDKPSTGGMNCSFGVYFVTSFVAFTGIAAVLLKRKH